VIADKGLNAGLRYYWNIKITDVGRNIKIGVTRIDNDNIDSWFTGSEKGWGMQGEEG
jgi:hypothetical protein